MTVFLSSANELRIALFSLVELNVFPSVLASSDVLLLVVLDCSATRPRTINVFLKLAISSVTLPTLFIADTAVLHRATKSLGNFILKPCIAISKSLSVKPGANLDIAAFMSVRASYNGFVLPFTSILISPNDLSTFFIALALCGLSTKPFNIGNSLAKFSLCFFIISLIAL